MIEIKNFCKSYGENVVYENFNLALEDSKITCILGESGCGKTTLLNAVAGLIDYGGEITPVKVSYHFQSPRLVPNLTVIKNLTLVGANEEEAVKMLTRVGLAEKKDEYPLRLSGGEAQRAALCRAFLHGSDILLLDEPFSSLDLKTKFAAMELFKELLSSDGRPALMVTHDVDEALSLADRIVVLVKGRLAADFNKTPAREEIVEVLVKG